MPSVARWVPGDGNRSLGREPVTGGQDLRARGRAAYERRSWGDAYGLLSAAIEHDPLPAEDLDRLAVAAYLTGRFDPAGQAWEHAYSAFIASDQLARAVRCAFWHALTLFQRGEHARGGGWLARAQGVLEEAGLDCVEWGYLRIPVALGALDGGDPPRAYAEFDEILAIAERFGDPDLRSLAQLGRGQALVMRGDATRGLAMLDEAMLASTTGEVSAIAAGIVYCGVIVACQRAFDLRRAVEWTAAMSHWCAAQQDLKPYRGQCLVHRSEIMQLRGEWSDAIEEVRRVCEGVSDPGGDPLLGMALYQQAELLRLRGDLARAEEAYREASDRGHPTQPGLALLRLAQGRVNDAMAAIRRAVAAAAGSGERARLLVAHVEIALAAGDVGTARQASDDLGRIAAAFDSPYLRAVGEYARGCVHLAEGDATGACSVLRRSWLAWQELDAPYESARVRLRMAQAFRRLADDDCAEMELDAARRVFERVGAAPDLAEVAALAEVTPVPTGGLSARELEVLRLVATGVTNREIADTLVLSEKTVARHMGNIFTKLGISSRSAATAYAYQHDLA